MGYTRDQWFARKRQSDGTWKREPTARHGKGKRYMAVWRNENGQEESMAFPVRELATRHWKAMETDIARGDYQDPKAGRELVRDVGARWLAGRGDADPSSWDRYESVWRLHVKPALGRKRVSGVKPSEISAFLTGLAEKIGPSTAQTAHLVLYQTMQLAVADGLRRANPVASSVVKRPYVPVTPVENIWPNETVWAIIDAHPPELRLIPVLMAGCGLRIGEALAVSLEDFDFDKHELHVRRQLKRIGSSRTFVFALPKGDKPGNPKTRVVPVPNWVMAYVQLHIETWPPRLLSLPWERATGDPESHKILFRWSTDDSYVRYRLYSEQVWKPALVIALVIPAPVKDARGRRRYVTARKEGPHQLRHFYASVMLSSLVSVNELAEYLGHDPVMTLRVYGHLVPSSHKRAREAMDSQMYRPRAISHRA
jgi:integrase